MTRRLLLAYLSITAFTLVVVIVPLGITFASRERDRLEFDLERDAQAISSRVEDSLETDQLPDLDAVFNTYDVAGGRIVVTNADGISVADSGGFDLDRDFSTRPEFELALSGERNAGERRSDTLEANLVYVAIPVASGGRVHGAVRITVPSAAVDDRVQDTWLRLGGLSAVVLATVGAVGLILARGVTRPVRQVQEAAERLAAGNLDARAGEVRGPPELTALAKQFDVTAKRLEHLVVSQRRFVADASHQLRTPLTALRLRLETLQPSPADEPRVAAALAETDRLSRLVQSLLVIARSESTRPALVDIDLHTVTEGRLTTLAEVAGQAGVTLELETTEHPMVQSCEGGAEQILDNLISNAISATPAGTTVTVRIVPLPGGGATLTVTDEGPGMTADECAEATARFWRAPDSTGTGSGLGLAIADHLATSGGGELSLQPGPANVGLAAAVTFAAPRSQSPPEGET